jgi:hypothetical protein
MPDICRLLNPIVDANFFHQAKVIQFYILRKFSGSVCQRHQKFTWKISAIEAVVNALLINTIQGFAIFPLHFQKKTYIPFRTAFTGYFFFRDLR